VIEVLPDPAPLGAESQELAWEFDTGAGFAAFANPLSPFYEAATPGRLRVTETIRRGAESRARSLVLTVAEAAAALPSLPALPVVFDGAALADVALAGERVAGWRNAAFPAAPERFEPTAATRMPVYATLGRRRAVQFDTAGEAAPNLSYPQRFLRGEAASVQLRADDDSLWTHSFSFQPTRLVALRHIVSLAASGTTRRNFVLQHTAAGALVLRLMQPDASEDTLQNGYNVLIPAMTAGTPYALTLRKRAPATVEAFVGAAAPVPLGVGAGTVLASSLRLGQVQGGTFSFEGFFFDWIAEPAAADDATCLARNALLLERARPA
jgi:hypothetical protein